MIDEDLLVAIYSDRSLLTLLEVRPLTTNYQQQGQATRPVIRRF